MSIAKPMRCLGLIQSIGVVSQEVQIQYAVHIPAAAQLMMTLPRCTRGIICGYLHWAIGSPWVRGRLIAQACVAALQRTRLLLTVDRSQACQVERLRVVPKIRNEAFHLSPIGASPIDISQRDVVDVVRIQRAKLYSDHGTWERCGILESQHLSSRDALFCCHCGPEGEGRFASG